MSGANSGKQFSNIGRRTFDNVTWTDQVFETESWTRALVSQEHPGWRKLLQRDEITNVGGPFSTVTSGSSRYLSSDISMWTTSSPIFGQGRYEGALIDGGYPAAPSSSIVDPANWAAEAYKRMKPTKPSFQALNYLAELRDLPGMLKQRFTRDLRGAASKHVQIQFGWLPLLSDLRKLIALQKTAQQRLAVLIENNGKPIRRRTHIVDIQLRSGYTEYTAGVGWVPALPSAMYLTTPKAREWLDETTRVWASARFRYWLPPGPRNIDWTNMMMRRIYGFNVTPEVVYNAVPWTWLADWFSNTGDVLSNLDAGVADRLAADYFYVMAHSSRIRTREVSGLIRDPRTLQVANITSESNRYYIQKRRVVGDPFGWNTSENSLTSMQLSILGALGLSRLR